MFNITNITEMQIGTTIRYHLTQVRTAIIKKSTNNKCQRGCEERGFNSWVGKICWRRDRLPTPAFLGFSCGSAGQESTHNAGELGSIPGLGRSNGEGKGYPLQYFGLENSMNCIVHGVPCCIAHGTDLEIVTKSKVSQKEKNKYHILMHICWI